MEYAGVAKHHAFCPITTGQNKAEYVLKCQSVYVTPYHIATMKIEHIQGTVYTVRTAIESESPMMTNRMCLSLSLFLSLVQFQSAQLFGNNAKKIVKKQVFCLPRRHPGAPSWYVLYRGARGRKISIYCFKGGNTLRSGNRLRIK